MTLLTSMGQLTLGDSVPVALSASAELAASVNLMLPEVNAKIAGLVALQASLTLTPPSLAGNLQVALDLVASLQASLSLGLPGLDFQLTAVAALLAELNVFLGALLAKLDLALSLQATLGTPGIFAYQYIGPVGTAGNELQVRLAGGLPGGSPADTCYGWFFIATDAGAINAAKGVFATP